jgi:hypothetical protein
MAEQTVMLRVTWNPDAGAHITAEELAEATRAMLGEHGLHGYADHIPRATGQDDGFEVTATHCGAAMRWKGSHVRWEGPRGRGYEIATARYICDVCRTTLRTETALPC